MYSCLTRVTADDIKKRFYKRSVISLNKPSFNYNDYAILADQSTYDLSLEVKKAWDEFRTEYSEDDMMAVDLIISELTSNAVRSSLERLEKENEHRKKNPDTLLENEIRAPKVSISLTILKTGVEIVVEDYGLGLPKDLNLVAQQEDSKIICNFKCGGRGLKLIKDLSQVFRISYRNKYVGFRTNELDPEKISGSIISVWRFALGSLN